MQTNNMLYNRLINKISFFLIVFLLVTSCQERSFDNSILVNDIEGLNDAILNAKAGDEIVMMPFVLEGSIKAPFILDHSTGNWPKNDEVDEPIVYGDYYFLETLIRLKN